MISNRPTSCSLRRKRQGNSGDGIPLVKVIDFGLAKAVDAAAQAAGPGETRGGFVGTPAFASPEQFRGAEDAGLDHRADIYSLGATLWYALCGRAPFTGRTLEEIHARQGEPLPTGQLLSPRRARSAVVALLASTLAFDADERPQSARELLERLERCQDRRPARISSRERTRLRWLAVAALALLAVATGVWWHVRQPPVDATAARSLAVLPFENASPDPDDAFYTTGICDEITADLTRAAALKVISPDSANQYQPGPRDFARIGSELGVRYLLTGRVRREHGRIQVEVRLVDAVQAAEPWVQTYDRPLADAFLLQGEIARAVADRLRTPLSREEKAAIDRPPTTDATAYDLYLRARGDLMMTVGETQARTVFGHCLALLGAGHATRPELCLGLLLHRGLGGRTSPRWTWARRRSGRWTTVRGRSPPWRKRAGCGPTTARCIWRRPGTFDRDRAAIWRRRRSRSTWRGARCPTDASVETISARIAENTGHWEEAVAARERAVALDPRDDW